MADNPFSTYLYRQQGPLFPQLINPGGLHFDIPAFYSESSPSLPALFGNYSLGGRSSLFPSLNITDANGVGFLQSWLQAELGKGQKSAAPAASPSSTSKTAPTSTGSSLTGGDPGVMKWSADIDAASKQLGVPADVIAGIMEIESGGDAGAVSSAGATGLMQVMPNYHQERAAKYGGNLNDPRTNILTGADLLKENFDRAKKNYGVSDDDAWNIAAAAYLGDWNWNTGTYAGSSDAYGTNGPEYVSRFDAARSHYQTQPVAGTAPQGHGSVDAITNNQHYPVTQEFGPSELSGEPAYNGYAHFHEGLDVGVPMNTPLTAPISGTVISAQVDGGFGNSVVLQTDDGYTIRLGHMSSFAVDAGQRVDAGTLLGYSGSTGYSTGPHVHIQIQDADGNPIDPNQYFSVG